MCQHCVRGEEGLDLIKCLLLFCAPGPRGAFLQLPVQGGKNSGQIRYKFTIIVQESQEQLQLRDVGWSGCLLEGFDPELIAI